MSSGFIVLSSITFLSAFLLFQIELIIAKIFLPNYGGSYLVWGACIVFFQAALLAGYVLAHQAIERFGITRYIKAHCILLFLPFLFFPGRNIELNSQAGSLPLVLDIFLRLLLTIGPVFIVLSTVSLVTQAWLASSREKRKEHPYVLYAISNVGSFAALLTYPFIVEYLLTNTEQLNIWRGLYVLLVLLNLWAFKSVRMEEGEKKAALPEEPVSRVAALRWVLLSAAGVVLFLSVTNVITYEAAPVPLLWIIPLGIYLISFVLTFGQSRFNRWIAHLPFVAFPLALFLFFNAKKSLLTPGWTIILFSAALFLLCLYAQNELIRTKPSKGRLTFFYVMISLGGFLGGFVTSWIVPLVSNSPVEFLLGLGLLAVTHPKVMSRVFFTVAIAIAFVANSVCLTHPSLIKMRNYYGIYDIFDKNGVRTFIHGTTLHGLQWVDEARRFVPIGYYSPHSPMGEVLINDVFQARRIGAVGLGAGTSAMYSRLDCPMDFYELDPDVYKITKKYFWYLNLAPGLGSVIIGDARVSLAHSDKIYDVLLIDAFGGDAIPFHLINTDVMRLYRQHLTERGGVLFHIPNRYFDLEPVIANIAHELGAYAAVKNVRQDGITMQTSWAVVTWDEGRFVQLRDNEGWKPLRADDFKPMRAWSDDYSTILPIIKWGDLLSSLQHFKIF